MERKTERKQLEDFDDILTHVGGWGNFQYRITLVFFLFNIFLGYVFLSPIITLYTPPHWCHIPGLANLSMEQRRELAIPRNEDVLGGFSQCEQYRTDWSQVLELLETGQPVLPSSDWEVVECEAGWEYNMSDYHVSVTVEQDWVCHQAWIPALSQSLFFGGAIPGMIFFGWLADAYGRIPAIMATNIIALITGVITPFASDYISFLVLRFAMGLCFNTFFTSPYILVLEYVAVDKRTLVGNIGMAIFFTLSGVYQPWLAKYLGHWKIFNWVIFAQMITIFIIPFLLPESCRWLLSRGRTEKTLTILRKIAKINKRDVPEEVYQSVEQLCQVQNKGRTSYTYLDLFRTGKMRRLSLLSIFLWMVITCVFDTTVRNISNLNFEFYTSFMITSSMELPADVFTIVGITWFGRRWSATLSLLLCGLTMVVCAFVKELNTLQIIVFLIGRFFSTYAMNVGLQYTVELMPTCLRGQGTALVNVMSMVSSMASPYIVYSSVLSEKAPFLITAILCVLGAVPSLFLPETSDIKMPDSLEDIKEFGRHDRLFWMPLCKSRRRFKKSYQDPVNITQLSSSLDNEGFSKTDESRF